MKSLPMERFVICLIRIVYIIGRSLDQCVSLKTDH